MSACTWVGGSSSWQPPTWKAPSRARACTARRGRASVVRYSCASGAHAGISIDGALWQDIGRHRTASGAVSVAWLHGTVHSCPWVCYCVGSCMSRHGSSVACQQVLHLNADPHRRDHTAPMSLDAGRGLAAAEGAAGVQHRLGWGFELDGGQGWSFASGGRLVSTFAPIAARR